MSFERWVYDHETKPILTKLINGDPSPALTAVAFLKRVKQVLDGSRPTPGSNSQHWVPFHGHYLVFVVSAEDPTVLRLAAVVERPARLSLKI